MDNRRQSSGGRGGSVPANNPSFSGGAGANLSALDWAIGLRYLPPLLAYFLLLFPSYLKTLPLSAALAN